MDEDVAQFMTITGIDNERVARGYLEISGSDPMQAIQLFFESPELAANFTNPASAAAAQSSPALSRSTRGGRSAFAGREDAQGVITIDSDDDGDDHDVEMSQADNDDGGDDDIAAVARAAQEEDDADMARRLQEEMYGQGTVGGGGDEEGIRAPMGRTTETLVAPDPSWSLEDDREAAVLEQLRRRRQPPSRNPFSQASVWDDPGAPGVGVPPVPMGSRPGGPPAGGRSQRLADMFRPPYDLISHLSWDDARQEGKDEKRWIMVNVQDMSDFNCQTLNRDHWKDENIKALLKEHFIFLQYDKDSPRAQEYIGFYFGQGYENPDNYPYVAIIDPRTGEQVKLWSGPPFPGKAEFYSELIEFLDRYSLAANSKNPVPKTKPKSKPVDFDRLTEEQQLEMALQNSLESNGSSSKARPSEQDPDELTKSIPDLAKGEGTSATASPFSLISSNDPHVEPEHNPATATRIQFRHPAGRVIRRFETADPVRRIYEWLKAEPLDGKEGVPFELKAQPGGDLIDKLDISIEQAGLKQGTVMIEFLEDE
ncbi:hypothetical protein JX265_008622 [Neoarthrinium moseri]|uniref:UBX domain-containing protein n=1 Tax=Neoarthrinium moseri TaxID=1658444 RepID=A0A9P9WHY1_9PEZI|nr:hypothetical protein JX265_008622 [Neoarthrinium moseri]